MINNYFTYHEYGRYGEHFIITNIEEDKYLVSCYELNIDYDDSINNFLTKSQFDELHKRYVEIGDPIDREDTTRLMDRAANMGKELSRYYHLFNQRTNDDNTSTLY